MQPRRWHHNKTALQRFSLTFSHTHLYAVEVGVPALAGHTLLRFLLKPGLQCPYRLIETASLTCWLLALGRSGEVLSNARRNFRGARARILATGGRFGYDERFLWGLSLAQGVA